MKRVADLRLAACGCAFVVAASLAGGAAAQVLSAGPTSRFEALFEHHPAPVFLRPDVSALFPPAEPLVGEPAEEVPLTTAEAEAATDAPAPLVAGARTATKLIKELVISPAESAPAPPPPQEIAAAPAEPPAASLAAEEPAQAQATGTVAPAVPPVRAEQATRSAAARLTPPTPTGRRLGVTRAAWYQHPGRTASGETYNPDGLTAAHRTLPLGTRVRVVNRANGRSVVVRINDRVPKTAKLPVDLSRASARAIGMTDIAPVALYEVK
jgi:rare lipoprotein A